MLLPHTNLLSDICAAVDYYLSQISGCTGTFYFIYPQKFSSVSCRHWCQSIKSFHKKAVLKLVGLVACIQWYVSILSIDKCIIFFLFTILLSLYITLHYTSFFTELYRIKKLIVCSFHQAPADVSISTVTPISCRELWKHMSKPLCPSTLWDRRVKVLRGVDLGDLFSAMCFFLFLLSACAFLLLWHSCQRKGPSRPTCLTPNSMITPVFRTLQIPRASL